nr:uncharacterized protein LOC109152193 [Ipomoea batatas]
MRAGGKRGTTAPVNRWLVLDPAAAEAASSDVGEGRGTVTSVGAVTPGGSMKSQLGGVNAINSMINEGGGGWGGSINAGKGNHEGGMGLGSEVSNSAVNAEEDDEGVIVTEQKRKRVSSAAGSVSAPTSTFSPIGRSIEGGSSDHLPLLLITNGSGVVRIRRRPRYENTWGRHPDCRMVVEEAWQSTVGRNLGERVAECGRRVWEWGSRVNRAEGVELRQCEFQMKNLRGRRDAAGVVFTAKQK